MSTATSNPPEAAPKKPNYWVPWNPWLAVGAVVFIYIFTQLVGIQLVAIYPAIKHWSSTVTNDWLTNDIFAQFFYVLIAEAMTLGLVWWFLRVFKTSLRVIGLVKPKLEDILFALSGLVIYFPAYIGIVTLISSLIPALNVNQTQQIGFQNPGGTLQYVLVFISLVILPPIVEEIIFRGFLYTSLRKKLPIVWAALLTSLIFAAPHLLEGGSGGLLWIAGIDTFILSLVLVWLRQKTDRLYAGMGLHALKNFVAFASLYLFHMH
jgi:membrane protease YdiL (CAAX protease family)